MTITTTAMLAEIDLHGIPTKVRNLRGVLLQDLGKVLSDERYAEDYRREQANKLFTDARQQIDRYQREAEQARDAVTEWINEAAATGTGDAQRELLDLMKQRDAWERIKRQLDHGVSAAQVVEEAAGRKDLAALVGMQRELPVYGKVSGGMVTIGMAGTMAQVERAVADLLPGDRGVAERHRIKLGLQWEEAVAALQGAREHVVALQADPAGHLRRAARLEDVERNGSGFSVSNGVVQSRGSRSGGEFTGTV
ncbi:hypothetical protein [Nonomuraea typhae]|uniref:Uncharacterized protein n=1 Tax=Nonomuraea typhae TaxID=2603600 RepID=A0ABW7YKK7_9ACTN